MWHKLDVLWFRLPRKPGDPQELPLFAIGSGHLLVVLSRTGDFQLGYVIPKGTYRQLHDAGIQAGIKFGVLLALFMLGAFVLHNHMLLNIGWRLTVLQGIAYVAEWFAVGVVISLVYRG